MKLSPEQLEEIERLAGLLMKPADIAIIVGINKWYLNKTEHAAGIAYKKGKLLCEAELRKSVIMMAKQGSSPAQTLAARFLDDMNAAECDLYE